MGAKLLEAPGELCMLRRPARVASEKLSKSFPEAVQKLPRSFQTSQKASQKLPRGFQRLPGSFPEASQKLPRSCPKAPKSFPQASEKRPRGFQKLAGGFWQYVAVQLAIKICRFKVNSRQELFGTRCWQFVAVQPAIKIFF